MIKRIGKFHRIKALACMGLAFVMLMTGCGQEPVVREEIELIDPVATANINERVARRTLYDYEVIEGNVFPIVTEYPAGVGMNTADIGFFPGQRVNRGSVLFSGDMQDYLSQEENLRNSIDNLVITYAENRRVNELKLKEYGYFIDSRLRDCPEDSPIRVIVQRVMFERDLLEQNMESDEAVYELDLLHYNDLLYRLTVNEAKRKVVSGMSGTVVAVSNASPGAWVSEGTNVAAVTDGKSFNILATYKSAKLMSSAEEYYAMVDGRRYDVTYIPYSATEISALKASGREVYSVFEIDDPEGNVKPGQKVSIVIIYSRKDNTLSISREAVHRDDGGYYVNRVTGDKVYITRGITDGMFVEILDGLEDGDEIMIDTYSEAPENVVTVGRGDFFVRYEGTGYLSYPDITNIINDVKYGTVTLVKKNVVEGQRVKKGEVIAYVSVTPNNVTLEELTLRLMRLGERRERAQDAVDDPMTEYLDSDVREQLKNAVSSLDRQIQSVSDQIIDLQTAYSVTAFYAPCDGVIGYMTELSDGAVLKSNERIATVAAISSEYLYAQNDAGTLLYGMELTGTYENPVTKETVTFPVSVASVSFAAVGPDLASDQVYIKPAAGSVIPGGAHDTTAEFSAAIPSGEAVNISNPWEAWQYQQAQANASKGQAYKITGYTEYETNVILVPAKAVTFVDRQAYVMVFEDGQYVRRGFVAGGGYPARTVTIDSIPYVWAIEGIDEGTVVVY
jgi:multidrug efflux pump subunit AcrA (membrane-fusion protein)